MKKEIITSILAIGFTSALAIAAGTPVPYIFQGGDPASATQVNANFQELADRIENASSSNMYDYHAYVVTGSNIKSKTYNTTGRCGDIDVRNYSQTDTASGTELTVTIKEIDSSTGIACRHNDFNYLNTATEFQRLGIVGYDPINGTYQSTMAYDDPIVLMTSTMKLNSSWADGVTTTVTAPPSAPASGPLFTQMYTLAGVEDVTVPYNGGTTYTGCLKFHKLRFGADVQEVAWYCPDVGYVKSIITRGNSLANSTRELSDIQY